MGTLRGFDQFMNLVINNTVEVNGEEKNEICMVVKYEGFLEEKYGKERNKHSKFDKDLWSRAEGKNKGKVYGLGNDSDPCVHSREDPFLFLLD
ncbi:putative LSM domain, eukaryotic/archaea-type, LSM domain superfamily protein [Helianthus annuus]|uniref:LSM domain, eukaryotic/archaea-type, LSM domain superfamily protein n=1 Tax=Helianthus annuus TaxID=4232 RepID=A0A251UHN7_HELAN|nr:putative LSM domain, eukaryotic/archaea-type, LSM domain superfamily protein [Helianthus annuus]KAJ0439312.1 putative sm-like protein Lsm7/SmG [Helianthus annuus]KAJ0566075.1 putative LSM domain, eukaryotic/archaea-type, LSM domain superfamily protein [Helianthus annuus]KAJ0572912.1 putative sm-like protein Lsm7/SmG [Helianthus annuus]KAJ0911135.1 putative LSM domain, eukaryotic/archaea-type, LSM domain superfamily protein [Helianthus annuus]